MKRQTGTIFLICFFALTLVSSGIAQPGQSGGPGRHGGPGDGPPRERMEQFRKMKLLEYLNLDEETSARFITRYNKHQDEMHELFKQRAEAIDALGEAVKDSREKEYQKCINDVLAVDKKIFDARMQFLDGLGDILTKKQQAKVIVFERDFNRDVREMILDSKGKAKN